jgi:hypothetical protein
MNKRVSTQWQIPMDATVACMLMFASLPQSLTLDVRLYGVPIQNAFYLLNILVIGLTYAIYHPGRKRALFVYLGAGLYLAAQGFFRRDDPLFDTRSALQDMTTYAALPLGLALGQLKGKAGLTKLLTRCYLLVAMVFAANIILIHYQYLESAGNGERQLDLAMFTSDIFICMSFPCVWLKGGVMSKTIAVSGMMLCAIFAITSATRSMFIIFTASLLLTAIIETKRNHRYLYCIPFAALVLTAQVSGVRVPGLTTFQTTLLAQRLESTEYQNENRYEEFSGMLSQMGAQEWIFGSGFGTQFESPIPENGLTVTPHIGISAFLYKGGLPVFAFLIAGPCLYCLLRLLKWRASDSDTFLAGVAVYLLESCVSGGWAFIALFFLGAFLKLGLEKQRRSMARHRALLPGTLDLVVGRSREPRAIGNVR